MTDNSAPTFTEGTTTIRSIAENTATNTNIDIAVGATDTDADDTLAYTLGGRDAASFAIVSTTGQLQTKASLDYETKSVYLVTITVSDGTLSDTISVIISIIDVADTTISTVSLGVGDRTPEVRDAIVAAVQGVTDAANVTAAHLAAITALNLRNNGITSLKAGDFSGLSGLTSLNLYGNMLSSLSDGIFSELTSLTSLRLGGNNIDPIPIIVSLEQVSSNQYRVVIPTGAPFDVSVPIVITDGRNAPGRLDTVTVSKGSVRSETTTGAYIDIGALPSLPANHFGYVLSKSATCNVTLQVAEAIAAAVPGVTDCRNVSAAQLAVITSLDLSNKSITSLQSSDFTGLLSLSTLNLENNQLSSLPNNIFSSLPSLNTLQLSGNTGAPFSFEVSLEKIGTNQFRAVLPVGASFDISLPISVTNGSAANNASTITIAKGSVDSGAITVTRATNTVDAVTVDIGTLPSIPITHNGYALSKSTDLPLEIFSAINAVPVFTEGVTTTRSIAENTAAGTNIGSPVSATDGNSSDTLAYSLSGTDAASFAIVKSTGQLQTKDALDYETKDTYTVTITVSDDKESDTITVTINVTDVVENNAPVFTEGTSTSRSIAENTPAGQNIGTPVAATDADTSNTLTYRLGGTDASVFAIVNSTGQLQTNLALNYERKPTYTVIVTVSDAKGGSDSINVTINVANVVDEGTQQQTREETVTNTAPVFTDGDSTTRSIAENTVAGTNIGSAIGATDADALDTLNYSLGGTDASVFAIVNSTGQLQTNLALNYERKETYTVIVTVSDAKGGSDSINVTINVANVVDEGTQQQTREETVTNTAPVFTDGDSTTRSIAENTVAGTNIGSAIGATDADALDTLNYSLGGTDASVFAIVNSTGQLQTNLALNYERKETYTVIVTVSDAKGGSDSINVTINVANVVDEGTQQQTREETVTNTAPVFTDGDSTTRSIAENTVAGTNIGSAIGATDADVLDTLNYSLGGTDANSFAIASATGQLQTKDALDYETKTSYSVTITVSDQNAGTDTITVTINVTDVVEIVANTAPVFTEGASTTRAIAENTVAGTNIGSVIGATDADALDTLSYSLGGTDANSFAIASATGQLQTKDALDYETKTSYSVTITVSDQNGGTDTITVTINVTDVVEGVVNNVPVFTEGASTTRSIAENTVAGTNIGSVIAATDADTSDTLTYTLSGTDASAFTIVGTSGQLQTSDSLNYEVKSSYSVTVAVSDNRSGTDSIDVTININDVNDPPRFVHGTSITIGIPEDADRIKVGPQFDIIDEDRDALTVLLPSGPERAPFRFEYGRSEINIYLKKDSNLDFETKSSYSFTLGARDDQAVGEIDVTINLIDAADVQLPSLTPRASNRPPYFYLIGTWVEISEDVGPRTLIGGPIGVVDPDDDPLVFTLSGADAALFDITYQGQLRTKRNSDFVPFNYETKRSYSVTVTISDRRGGTASNPVTINIANSNEAPVFDEGTTTTRNIAENSTAGINIGSAFSVTDQDADDTITYTLGGTDTASFSIDGVTGQLKTKAALDYETKSSYTVTITATDEGSLTDTITVTISVRDLNETPSNNAPVFTDGETATRSVAENTAKNTNIGTAVAATDADAGSTLSYQLSSTDAAAFSIDDQTGQLKTNAALDYETKNTYTVTVTVTDGSSTDTITVTIDVTDANDAPVFSDGDSTIRNVNEGVSVGTNIGATVIATDIDKNTLNYTLGGTDAASFSINANNGQLRANAALRFETKASYTVTVTVSDGSLTDTIDVTINVHNVNSGGPAFVEGGSTTRTVEEQTAAGTNIGSPLTAVDIDHDALSYGFRLPREGGDGRLFDIERTTGQLKTKAALDYETKNTYNFTVYAWDGKWSVNIDVTVNVTKRNNSPVFSDGASATRSVAENTAADENIGAPVSASDADSDRLTYTLGGTNAASFSIDSATGQIKTKAELDYETKNTYTVTLTVSDDKAHGTVSIPVTINVTDIANENNSAPVFTEGNSTTRSVTENTAAGENIGTAVSATDANNDTLAYTLSGTDAASFTIVSTTGQLKTSAVLNYETKSSYTVTITVSDGKTDGTDSINVTINVTDVNELNNAPEFTDGTTTTRFVGENTAAGENIGTAVSATDANNDTLTYTLGGTDAASFAIVSTTGQLQTNAALDYETTTSYTVTVSVSDNGGGSDTITVTINVVNVIDTNQVPVFSDGATTTRSVIENIAAGEEIGSPVTATDPDGDTITYSLGGTDAASFDFDTSTAQLKSKVALDYETTTSYTITIIATDSNSESSIITVTINVTDSTNENSPPVFSEGSSTTRSLDEHLEENHEAWTYIPDADLKQNVGSPITATDADSDTLTYEILGENAYGRFRIDSSGQLSTKRWINYEEAESYSFTVSVKDRNGGSDSIDVTVNITNINEQPYVGEFPYQRYSNITQTYFVDNGSEANTNIGDLVTVLDFDANTTLSYSLSGTDATSFTIDSSTAQLTNNSTINISTKDTYSLVITASDSEKSITINVTIKVVIPTSPPVSARSAAIRQALVDAISGVDSPEAVTAAHLSSITSLRIIDRSITFLSAGDFNGLSELTTLDLTANRITSLPSGILDEMPNLRTFNASYNRLTSLNGDLFQNCTGIQVINLKDNDVDHIPDGIFVGLTSLHTLSLRQVGEDGAEYPHIRVNVVEVDDDDDNDQTASFKLSVPTGAPRNITAEVWSYWAPVTSLTPHRKVTSLSVSKGETESAVASVQRSDIINIRDDAVIYLGTKRDAFIPWRPKYDSPVGGFTLWPGEAVAAIPVASGAPSAEAQEPVPETTALLPNFPNPFNPETWIPYQLAKPSNVSITIYDIRGNVVRQLNLGQKTAGYYTDRPRAAHWDGRNATGERVANGVYFYQLKAGDLSYLRKMLIVK